MIKPEEFARLLQSEILTLPEKFYGTFEYTTTGHNYTHPVTLGLIFKVLHRALVDNDLAIDFRLNDKEERLKFQPDLVVLNLKANFECRLFIDYESPNSSDARVTKKDVDHFLKWLRKSDRGTIPYFIVTTLPNDESPRWELRYTTKGDTNGEYGGDKKRENLIELRKNPFRFWYSRYKKELEGKPLDHISFINIDRKNVQAITLATLQF